jgi:RNase adaptor protein for sRNA GlmZ degradation
MATAENSALDLSGNSKQNAQTPNTTQTPGTLFIYTYDAKTKPNQPLDLEYDIRVAPNPPKAERKQFTGQDEELINSLIGEQEFRDVYDRATSDIERLMRGDDLSTLDGSGKTERERRGEEEVWEAVEDQASGGGSDGNERTVRVGCMCGSGHHRSVAFGELLANRKWPEGWKVELDHLTLPEHVRQKKNSVRNNSGGTRERLDAL